MEKELIPIITPSLPSSSETKSHALELFISKINEEINNFNSSRLHSNPSNIHKATFKAMSGMKGWDDIVIRLFDIGKGFFILYREEYISRTPL